ncbi:dynamin family protein [Lederbergia wuyishanensis]|uniref:Small GTP-binding protein n=1 Tax=Lederbergia wuyishanensis TaxID=1347903 RepID=A0ABU0D0S0_9BACI|nr:dynamin family protein [Lederbergia wuyishanensis]MCJ8006622.1 dynamin family protein [Lederbergia wuyishanensis]MDQ0342003.1 small GTP-binding protein [Lederbergia wuyishanensis]
MSKVLQSSVVEAQLNRILILMERFQEHGDQKSADKAQKLIKKLVDREFIVAFSGHFSAGKSTMINSLVGENILPSSPIPTSANLVKIHHAKEDYAKVFYRSEKPLLFNAPYDFATVKEFCKNGDVTEIEIGRKDSNLPYGVTVMDTPGVDSTDDAHRLSTESSLHLADVVFYVMDYNHVQSELNFTYTRNLLDHGVKLYLIINQIDKHNDTELSFQQYKQTVIDSFAAWNVEPSGVFFTSLKKADYHENEYETVKLLIDDCFSNQEEWLETTIEKATNQLMKEHTNWLSDERKAAAEPLEQLLADMNKEELEKVFDEEKQLLSQKEILLAAVGKWEKDFISERESLLQNAYLMPYETRELAAQFLKTHQPNFKAGLFFSKKKTELEREASLELFAESVKKQVESQIDWHLREWAAKKLSDSGVLQEDLQVEAQNLTVNFEKSLFIDAIKKGAGLTGEYILQYCEDVSSLIKKKAREATENFQKSLFAAFKTNINIHLTEIETKLNKMGITTSALHSLRQLERDLEEKINQCSVPTGKEHSLLQTLLVNWKTEQEDIRIFTGESIHQNEENIVSDVITNTPVVNKDEIDIQNVISKIDKAIVCLENEASFKRITSQLKEKLARLQNREYTIALFGAFSAGKSSFANALLGEKVLPVSPNPTTAAINRICPATNEHKHGTADVHFKTEEQMLADIAHSLSLFEIHCTSLADAYSKIPSILRDLDYSGKEKIHLSFLNAFHNGFKNHQHQLGTVLTTDLEEFHRFVGQETQSCFVESIDLYYDCEFTKQGITLVDTPGADSINARHTGVAFDYIKNADAILFVTYYNHAFSKADREFLIQLGRVKDAFELDKMFFIVNAIDLASSDEELKDVLDYVHQELVTNGIRFPKIFGISSKLALSNRNESKIDSFTREFNHFLNNDLSQLAIQSAESDYHRIIFMLDQLIHAASEDEVVKNKRIEELQTAKAEIAILLQESEPSLLKKQLSQEAKELLFYVKQRVFYRFPDFFKESFNPAVLQNNSRKLLAKCLEELLQSTGYDFAQELRATSLRLERYIQKVMLNRIGNLEKEIQVIKKELTVSGWEVSPIETPEFESAFKNIDRSSLEGSFKFFRNPKSFFEQNEKKKMEEALENLLSPLTDEYIQIQLVELENYYHTLIDKEFSKLINHVSSDVNDQFEGWLEALSDHEKLAGWKRIRSSLEG